MNELIKREDAINAVAELQARAQSKAELTGISKAWKRIKALPTVDAVPVVRCKNCLWRHDDSSPMWLPCMERETPNDWFCADGERRTE